MSDHKYPKWTSYCTAKLKRVSQNKEFESEIKKSIKHEGGYSNHGTQHMWLMLAKYEIPPEAQDFVRHYFATGEMDTRLIKPAAKINTNDGEVTISISRFARNVDITEFIRQNKGEISKLQNTEAGNKHKRVRAKTKAGRDRAVFELKSSGLTSSQIALRINSQFEGESLIDDDVNKILDRGKKLTKW